MPKSHPPYPAEFRKRPGNACCQRASIQVGVVDAGQR